MPKMPKVEKPRENPTTKARKKESTKKNTLSSKDQN
jgi:hypothetical protein